MDQRRTNEIMGQALEYMNTNANRKKHMLDKEGLAFIAGAAWADNNPCEGPLDFRYALQMLMTGCKVYRLAWGDGFSVDSYIWLKQGTTIKSEWCKDPILKGIADSLNGTVVGLPTICMKTAEGMIVTGWVPNIIDLFATDWRPLL